MTDQDDKSRRNDDAGGRQRRRKSDSGLLNDGNKHALTLASGVLATFLAYEEGLIGSESEQLKAAFDRIATLESARDADIERREALRATIRTLEARVSGSPDPLAPLKAWLDNLNQPGWIKEWDPEIEEFVMLYINPAYEMEYNLKLEYYMGKTDRDVHGEELHQIFKVHDLEVYRSKGYSDRGERAENRFGVMQEIRVWKWYVPLFAHRGVIAGVQYAVD